jgi:hypothetical protein
MNFSQEVQIEHDVTIVIAENLLLDKKRNLESAIFFQYRLIRRVETFFFCIL